MPREGGRGCTVSEAVTKAVTLALVTSLLQAGQGDGFGIPKFVQLGVCPPIKPQPDLSFERYSGIWFPVEMVPNEYVDIAYCAMTNYTWKDNLMLVEDRGLSEDGVKLRQRSVMFTEDDVPGMLIVDSVGVPSAPYVECPYMEKLDAVLEYSARLQAKAKAREMTIHKENTSTKAGNKQDVTSHAREDEEEQKVVKEEVKAHEDIPQQKEARQDMQGHQDHGTDTQHTAAVGAALSRSEAVQRGSHLLLPLLVATLLLLATSPSTLTW